MNLRTDRRADLPAIPAHFPDPVVRQMVTLDTTVIDPLDEQLRVLEQDLAMKAKVHEHLLITCCARSPASVVFLRWSFSTKSRTSSGSRPSASSLTSARLVKCAKESAGKKSGYSGKKIGNAYLKWAFSEAAVLFLRGNPDAQKAIARLASKHGKGKALSILAHRLGRAVYVMLTKRQPFDKARFMATL